MLNDNPSEWVRPNPVEALEFALAGMIAEEHFFKHSLAGGVDGDVQLWRIGFDARDVVDLSQLEDRLGESFVGIVDRTKLSVSANHSRILVVAAALARVENIMSVSSLEYSDDWRLAEGEVLALVQ